MISLPCLVASKFVLMLFGEKLNTHLTLNLTNFIIFSGPGFPWLLQKSKIWKCV